MVHYENFRSCISYMAKISIPFRSLGLNSVRQWLLPSKHGQDVGRRALLPTRLSQTQSRCWSARLAIQLVYHKHGQDVGQQALFDSHI